MDLKYLHTFRTIAETGSFSRAAEHLNYTRSAITFQIEQLERELSVPLFEKVGRSMALTKAGEQLVPYVEDVFQAIDRLRCFEDDVSQCRGELKIGVGETLLCYRLPPVLEEFHRRAPNARLSLRSMNCYDIRNELMDGTLDLGVFYADVGGFGSHLISRSLGQYPVVLVASPEVGRSHPDFITPDQRIPVPLIINEANCIFRQIFEQYLRERSILLDYTIELWSIPTIKNLVRRDMGVSFLPKFAVQEELRSGQLVEIPTGISHNRISAVCAHHKNKWVSPLMQLFLQLCEALSCPGYSQAPPLKTSADQYASAPIPGD